MEKTLGERCKEVCQYTNAAQYQEGSKDFSIVREGLCLSEPDCRHCYYSHVEGIYE